MPSAMCKVEHATRNDQRIRYLQPNSGSRSAHDLPLRPRPSLLEGSDISTQPFPGPHLVPATTEFLSTAAITPFGDVTRRERPTHRDVTIARYMIEVAYSYSIISQEHYSILAHSLPGLSSAQVLTRGKPIARVRSGIVSFS